MPLASLCVTPELMTGLLSALRSSQEVPAARAPDEQWFRAELSLEAAYRED